MPEAVVIGAGPAGSLAATLLARQGWRVTLIEQHSFPRDKVCGECLSALGIAVLKRAGLADTLLAERPAILRSATLHAPDGISATIPLQHDMWGLSRAVLDLRLLEAARQAGVCVLQPARCEALGPRSTGVPPVVPPRVTVRETESNRRTILKPDIVLLADGKGALLPLRAAATTDFGIKAHFADVLGPRDTIELFGVPGHYGGVAPIEGNRWNAAFSVPAEALQKARGDLDGLFASILRENVELQRQFSAARRVGAWCASALPRFAVSPDWPRGIIPLGNAAAALEPIGGEGMGLALRSAELAADFLAAAQRTPRAGSPCHDVADLRVSFHRLWQLRRPACRLAAKMLSSPALAGPTVQWLECNQELGTMMLNLMGKS